MDIFLVSVKHGLNGHQFKKLYKNETFWIQSLCFILRQYNMHNNMHPEIEDADVKSSYHPMISCCSKLGYWMWCRSTIIVNSAIYSAYDIWLVQHLDRQEQIREEIYLEQGVRTPYRLLWAHKLKLFVFRSVCLSLIDREVNAHRVEAMMQITIGLWSWRFWKKKRAHNHNTASRSSRWLWLLRKFSYWYFLIREADL